MFYYFFNAYKNEIYKKRNEITWKNLRQLKAIPKAILLGMTICLIGYVVCAVFIKNATWTIIFILCIIAIVILAQLYIKIYNAGENKRRCEDYKISEIEEVKKLLKRSEFAPFNSENGIDFLIDACKEMYNSKPAIEIIATSIVNILKIIAVPVAIAFYSVQIQDMSTYEAASIAIVTIVGLILIIGFSRISFVPIEDIIKKDSNIAAKLSDALKYIRLTVKTDAEKTIQLII